MDDNPYLPPQAELSPPPTPDQGPLVPWEDKLTYPDLWTRILETGRLMLRPSDAGRALGASTRVAPAVGFLALVGLPALWLVQIVVALVGPLDAGAKFSEVFGLPPTPAAPAGMESFQRTVSLVVALLMPIFIALGVAILGGINHLGLWMLRGLRARRGIDVTFRALLYPVALFQLVGAWVGFWVFLPPIPGLVLLGLSLVWWLGTTVYEGILLARAHDTDTWRGILGVLLIPLLLGCCCGGALFALGLAATALGGR